MSPNYESRYRFEAQDWGVRRPARRIFKRRTYDFTRSVTIRGETGVAHVEPILEPLVRCPKATTRVIVRWQGSLRPGATIKIDGRPLTLIKLFPMTAKTAVAHLLCIEKADKTTRRTS